MSDVAHTPKAVLGDLSGSAIGAGFLAVLVSYADPCLPTSARLKL